MSRWSPLLLLLLACGGPGTRLEDTTLRQPRFALQGVCAPSANSTPATLTSFSSSCVRPLSTPTLVESAAEFEALFDVSCERPAVNFAVDRVLVVPARGAAEWFVFPQFVAVRSDALEVGLLIRPQGALPPDAVVVLPRTPAGVELRWCRSVCVENCDVPIP